MSGIELMILIHAGSAALLKGDAAEYKRIYALVRRSLPVFPPREYIEFAYWAESFLGIPEGEGGFL